MTQNYKTWSKSTDTTHTPRVKCSLYHDCIELLVSSESHTAVCSCCVSQGRQQICPHSKTFAPRSHNHSYVCVLGGRRRRRPGMIHKNNSLRVNTEPHTHFHIKRHSHTCLQNMLMMFDTSSFVIYYQICSSTPLHGKQQQECDLCLSMNDSPAPHPAPAHALHPCCLVSPARRSYSLSMKEYVSTCVFIRSCVCVFWGMQLQCCLCSQCVEMNYTLLPDQ
jgi:hypothetical protein